MINRRLLRVKVLQSYYAYIKRGNDSLTVAEKELKHSIRKSYDLYFMLLLLPVEICQYARSRIELASQKRIPLHEDLHPNTKFIDNRFINDLEDHPVVRHQVEKYKLSWVQYPELIKSLYLVLLKSNIYLQYMEGIETGWEVDKKFVIDMYTSVIALSDELYMSLEEQSIYWNDDTEFIFSMIIKSIKKSKPGHLYVFDGDQVFKNEDDREFTFKLFRSVILKAAKYRQLIEKYLENWDLDRVALMDILIMELAITEMVEFPEVPLKVSFNEYIEISKDYSSNKSGTFINGLLDKITEQLKNEKLIQKKGKGLIGEIST